ncbi:MAG: redoxin domain-containing protein, partial [Planctomycetota bacterium]|nr:redoxin domain-containing protein [Planctomycetota bacterium]
MVVFLWLPNSVAFADDSVPQKKAPKSIVGQRFLDLQGNIHRLGGRDSKNPVVLVFMGTTCPISNRSIPKLGRIANYAKKNGLDFYGVIADPYTSRAEAVKHSKEFKIAFPVIFDGALTIASQLKPSHVPQAFVFSAEGEKLYSGAIDDSWADLSKPKARAHNEYLKDAVTGVVTKKPIKVASTKPIGCLFEGFPEDGKRSEVTFNRHIAPIIYKNCSTCHRPGEAAPFKLLSYKDVARRARQIALVTKTGLMPPWKPVKGHGAFMDATRLSQAEVSLLAAWAKAGAPQGKAEDAPKKPSFPTGWQLGKPDLVLKMKEAYTVRAEGADDFRCFVIPTGLLEDKQIVAMEYRPGSKAVVHHAILFLDDQGRGRKLESKDAKPGYGVFGGIGFPPSGSLGGYSPGAQAAFLPDGVARILKKGTDIILQVHYHPTGKVESDQGTIGLHFAKKPAKKILQGFFMGTTNLNIAPGNKSYKRHVELILPVPVNLIGVTPHMHYIGKEMKVVATTPKGEKIPLIWIKDWDFRWQGQYLYRGAVRLPAGTRIDMHSSYDNSDENPFNPSSPPKRVRYGDESTNEMCFVFFQLTTDQPAHIQALRYAMGQMF